MKMQVSRGVSWRLPSLLIAIAQTHHGLNEAMLSILYLRSCRSTPLNLIHDLNHTQPSLQSHYDLFYIAGFISAMQCAVHAGHWLHSADPVQTKRCDHPGA